MTQFFNDGDIIELTADCSLREGKKGQKYTLRSIDGTLYAQTGKSRGCACEEKWKLVSKHKEVHMNKIKFGVKYDRNGDPVELFESRKEADKRIEQLLEDSSVDKSSICLFEVGKIWEVQRPVTYKLVEMK